MWLYFLLTCYCVNFSKMVFIEPHQRFLFFLRQKYIQKILFSLLLQQLNSSTEMENQIPTLATGCPLKAQPEDNHWNAEIIQRSDVLDMTWNTEIFLGIFLDIMLVMEFSWHFLTRYTISALYNFPLKITFWDEFLYVHKDSTWRCYTDNT